MDGWRTGSDSDGEQPLASTAAGSDSTSIFLGADDRATAPTRTPTGSHPPGDRRGSRGRGWDASRTNHGSSLQHSRNTSHSHSSSHSSPHHDNMSLEDELAEQFAPLLQQLASATSAGLLSSELVARVFHEFTDPGGDDEDEEGGMEQAAAAESDHHQHRAHRQAAQASERLLLDGIRRAEERARAEDGGGHAAHGHQAPWSDLEDDSVSVDSRDSVLVQMDERNGRGGSGRGGGHDNEYSSAGTGLRRVPSVPRLLTPNMPPFSTATGGGGSARSHVAPASSGDGLDHVDGGDGRSHGAGGRRSSLGRSSATPPPTTSTTATRPTTPPLPQPQPPATTLLPVAPDTPTTPSTPDTPQRRPSTHTPFESLQLEMNSAAAWLSANAIFVFLLAIIATYWYYGEMLYLAGTSLFLIQNNNILRNETNKKHQGSRIALFLTMVCSAAMVRVHLRRWDTLSLNLVFQHVHTRPSFFAALELVVVLDVVTRFGVIACKCCVGILPYKLVKRIRPILFSSIEHGSRLYRTLLPIPVWYNYFHHPSFPWFLWFVLSSLYMAMKMISLAAQLRIAVATVAVAAIGSVPFGRRASKEEAAEVGGVCSICHDNLAAPIALHCSHIFCESCITTWLEREQTCPLCRAAVEATITPKRDLEGATDLTPVLF
eukprot:m.487238 g.487238  ORF g.487238 m.487238 type:complete len:659 (-) comp24902_c0_seq1:55-2031(-)